MQQIQSDSLKGVSETLLIPLHYRVEASKSGSRGFKDEVAEKFHDAIAYDWGKLDASPQNPVTAVRVAVFGERIAILDEQVRNFLEKTPDGLVVNLGAGLDTRFHRLDNGQVEWIELDLPEVIALRRKLTEPESKRHRIIAASVLDVAWIAEVKRHAGSRILFIAEGVLEYLTEEENRKIFACLAENFSGEEMLFTTVAPSLISGLAQYSLLSQMGSKVALQWGLHDSEQVSALHPSVEFVCEFPLLERPYDQLPEPVRQRLSPAMAKQLVKIVHIRFRE
jgi:O-methyltransferase involved in polyketide biosynthesis